MVWQLSLYRAATWALPLAAPFLLKRRLAKGKEDPKRWREKLGEANVPRPEGRLIWLHAVGLGEVLALRGLVLALSRENPALNFLLTSTARSSGQVVGGQLPPRTQHQFLPIDAPQYLAKFLSHWRPDLSIWAEQDLWPGAVLSSDQAGIPLVMVNARMNDAALSKRLKAKALYADLLARFQMIAAQDAMTARNLMTLGAKDVRVTGSLKAAAPALRVDEALLQAEAQRFACRQPWLLASSHLEDEEVALQAVGDRLLILAPRDPHRAEEISLKAQALGLKVALRSKNEPPETAQVYIADTFGEMGLWYRLCDKALIGGTFGEVNGHNPWEPAALDSAILHGPKIANFANDFAILDAEKAALQVDADSLRSTLNADLTEQAVRAKALWRGAEGSLAPLAKDILKVMA